MTDVEERARVIRKYKAIEHGNAETAKIFIILCAFAVLLFFLILWGIAS